ncbi:Dimethyl sulfoxide/trimethylamine N-oxide reductase [Carnimonas sp. R-84981]|uniref:molybdopterin-dependent oxidoreductase n=1 Tax=Carnimonas bestiolae TaxID=3402172 RepID=UPI003EDBDE09
MQRFTLSHWGIYQFDDQRAERLVPWRCDPAPSAIGRYQWQASTSPLRVKRPAVRKGWLENGPGPAEGRRGSDEFVEVEWPRALELVANEIKRVISEHGNQAIYAAPYGWSSAGRFHHSQTQARRFYNALGGFVASRHTYSFGTAESVMPMIAESIYTLMAEADGWQTLADHTAVMLCFGGLPTKNSQIESSGAGRHLAANGIRQLLDNGAALYNISPIHHQVLEAPELDQRCHWLPIRPATDTALLLALAHQLIVNNAYDHRFIERCTSGYQQFADYLLGTQDGIAKDAEWAATITDIDASRIAELGELLIDCQRQQRRVLINLAWGIQRAENGEQPLWAALALAALLGQLGLPGGGFAFGYGSTNSMGYGGQRIAGPRLERGSNGVEQFIPVARIADMLLHPGERYPFENQWRKYPHIRLMHWAGGNPFHHHQDLNRLCQAWQRPDTIIANEQFWTANARMADIVLPATTTLEREDIGYASNDGYILAMHKLADAPHEALSDHAIFSALAQRLDINDIFNEGHDEQGWLDTLYSEARQRAEQRGIKLPTDFAALKAAGVVEFGREPDASPRPAGRWARFREEPEGAPLNTPSGKIMLFHPAIADFSANQLAGHPEWKEPIEWLGSARAKRFPLHLISSQPANKLHSQLDHSSLSQGTRPHGREPITLSPSDAAQRGLSEGQLVKVFNERGACVAAVSIDAGIKPGVVKLATGAWFDPGLDFSEATPSGLERHGNPNVVTADRPSSSLTQGTSAMSTLVEVVALQGNPPELSCFTLPRGVS